jgi:uncharacterized protein (TIGR02217 family)
MADHGRIAQATLEVLLQNARGRVGQALLEVVAQEQARGRVGQAVLEAVAQGARGRVGQVVLEILYGSRPVPPLPRFPAALAYGAQGGPGFSTDVVLTADGQESRNINWAEARCRWDVGSIHRSKVEIESLIAFFHAAAQGQEGLFLFRDFTDDTFNNPIGTGDGATTTFHLVKVYGAGGFASTRRLTHPVEGTIAVALDGALTSSWTLDYGTGVLEFAAPPGAGVVVSASGEFEVVCRFAQDVLPVTRVAPDAYSCGQMEIVEVRQ